MPSMSSCVYTLIRRSATSTAFRRPPPMVVVARWSSSSIAGDEADAPGLPSAFPWRGAPKTRVRGLLKGVGYAFQQRNHRKMMHLSEEAILPGAEMAFVQVAAGAFQMRASQVLSPLILEEAGEGEGASEAGLEERGRSLSDMPEDDIVDPFDVMQKELADFYVQAVVSMKVSRCTAFYQLHRLRGSKISNISLYYGARRGDLPKGEDVSEFMGTKVVWESLSKDLQAMMRYRLLRDTDTVKGRLSSIRKTTVHVDVDILCNETFFVTDDRTNEVVQGSKAMGLRNHRLRLEGSPFSKRDFQWTAVDLDSWMKGNTFW